MSAARYRRFTCGHVEQLTDAHRPFVHCYQCGEIGVEADYLSCAIPTCKNEATRVIRYANGHAQHYCDECTPMAAVDEQNVLTERRFVKEENP